MKALIAFEIKKNKKTVLILAFVSGLMVFFSMMFFPTISENINALEGFLRSGFMQGIMSAFNINFFTIRTLLGFFATYCTMWIVLLGSVFFSYFGAELLAKEESSGSIEFLLSKPLSRKHIFMAKGTVLILSSIVFIIIVALLGRISIQTQLSIAPYEYQAENYDDSIKTMILENAQSLDETLSFTDEDFQRFSMGLLDNQLSNNREELKNQNIDVEKIMAAVEGDLDNPELLFEKILQNPDEYFELFQLEGVSKDEFIKGVNEELQNYRAMKDNFLNGNERIKQFFNYDPQFFFEYWIAHDLIGDVNLKLERQLTDHHVVDQFNSKVFLMLLANMLLIVFVNGALGLIIAVFSKDSQTSATKAMIVVLVLYFINSMGGISPLTGWLKYFTTFGYIETDVRAIASLSYKPFILLGLTIIGLYASYRKYQTKNFN